MNDPGQPPNQVVVVGGGVIGLSIAWELAQVGVAVTLIERGRTGAGASWGNAGLLVPSYSLPLGGMSAVREGLRALIGRSESLRLDGLTVDTLRWLAQFLSAGTMHQRLNTAAHIRALASLSLARYQRIMGVGTDSECGLRNTGWLDVYETAAALNRAVAEARAQDRLGNRWECLDSGEVVRRIPGLGVTVSGGILHPDDWVLRPDLALQAFRNKAIAAGVVLMENCELTRFNTEGTRVVSVSGSFGTLPVDHWIIAAGWESTTWLRQLKSPLSLMPGRGYSITIPMSANAPHHALNFVERHLVVAVQQSRVRITGGMDLGAGTLARDRERLAHLHGQATRVLPGLDWEAPIEQWAGSRPMTPRGRPIIGPLKRWSNVTVATGHGMLGMTLAPGTAALVKDYVVTGRIPPAMTAFAPT